MTPHGFGRRCMYFDYVDYMLSFGAISMPMRLGQCCQRLTGFTGLSGQENSDLGENYEPKKFSHLGIFGHNKRTSCLRI